MQALGGLLARRAEYHRCIAEIVVTSRDDDSEEKFDRSAREEADTSPNPIELSYESTIVEDIKELVFRARTMNGVRLLKLVGLNSKEWKLLSLN